VVIYGSAEADVDVRSSHAARLIEKLRETGGSVELLVLEGMDHSDTVRSFSDPTQPHTQAAFKALFG
jgi:hypothetical protein